jgi:hypothetical protein
MKCLRVTRLVAAATLACAAAHANAAELANPTGFLYYGYGNGSFGYTGAGYAPGPAYGPGTGLAPGVAGMAGYGAAPAVPVDYPASGYGGAGAYGYGGYGGCDACASRHCGRRRHCCSFGGNCDCCNNVWDGYGADCGYGAGCCAPPVKVHRRHRPLGCGAGPCVDAACGAPPRRHHCHLRRRWANACGDCGAYGYAGAAGMVDPGMSYDNGSMQPNMANPNPSEQVQPPAPSLNDDEPRPMPTDDSST